MIGHLELGIGTFTSHTSLAWLTKNLATIQSDEKERVHQILSPLGTLLRD